MTRLLVPLDAVRPGATIGKRRVIRESPKRPGKHYVVRCACGKEQVLERGHIARHAACHDCYDNPGWQVRFEKHQCKKCGKVGAMTKTHGRH